MKGIMNELAFICKLAYTSSQFGNIVDMKSSNCKLAYNSARPPLSDERQKRFSTNA